MGQQGIWFKAGFHGCHGLFGEGHAFLIDLAGQGREGMNPLLGHAAGPTEHGIDVCQQRAIPVLLQNAPAALDRVVLAVVRRVVQELDGFADVIGKFHHPFEELRALAIAFRPVVGLDLQPGEVPAFLGRQTVPPLIQAIDDEVAGFGRTAEDEVDLSAIFIHDTKRRVFFPATHVMIGGLVVTPGLAAARILANLHRRLAVHGQALDVVAVRASSILGVEVGEDGVGFRDFF